MDRVKYKLNWQKNDRRCNPEKTRAYCKKWRDAHPEQRLETSRRIRKRKQEWINQYKTERGCVDCGESHPAALDAHHVGGKVDSIGQLACSGSLERIKIEIEKCIILCSNCHRKRHHDLRT